MIHYTASDVGETVRIGSCGGNFTTPQGVLTSPSFPNKYPADQNCIYTIALPENTYITIRVHFFDIKCKHIVDSDGGADNLEMWEGSRDIYKPAKWCGGNNDIPALMHLAENDIEIRFAEHKIYIYLKTT